MNSPLIKICGVRSPAIARVVAECDADLMGLIFAPSRRQVSEAQAKQVVSGLSHVGDARTKVVGVFVNEDVDVMNQLSESVGLDYIQLSGDEMPELLARVSRRIIKALRLPAGTSVAAASREAERYLDCATPAWALLLDTHVDGSFGGNGIPGDWELARRLSERYPIILAGGLRPESVHQAIESVTPFGLDVSSGVESEGTKNPEKIRQFIAAARTVPRIKGTRAESVQVGSSNG